MAVKDRDPARVDDSFLIEKLAAELPGILLWMLEGLHRLLANRYQSTLSERSRRNLEAAMEDGDNLSQFMQAQAYVRFRPDSEERSTYLYRAYTKWCEDNLESPATTGILMDTYAHTQDKPRLELAEKLEADFYSQDIGSPKSGSVPVKENLPDSIQITPEGMLKVVRQMNPEQRREFTRLLFA